MYDAPLPSELAPTDTAEERREWRLQVLEELTGFSLNLARVLNARAIEQAEAKPEDDAPARVYARIARDVRLSLALHERFDLDRAAAGAQPQPKPAYDPMVPPTHPQVMKARGWARKATVRDCFTHLIEIEAREKGEGYETERLLSALRERLDEVDDITEFASEPIAKMVFELCQELGVKFDERVFVDKDWWTLPPAGGPWANPYAPAPGVNRERWSVPPDPGADDPP